MNWHMIFFMARPAPRMSDKSTAPQGGERFVDDYLLYLLARASSQASAQFHEMVKSRGLSIAEWRVLGMLSSGPATIGDLVAATLFQQPTLTKIVDRMAAGGFVRRTSDPDDGRRVHVSLTDRGREIAEQLVPLAKDHEARVLAGYLPEEAEALKAALRTLIARTES